MVLVDYSDSSSGSGSGSDPETSAAEAKYVQKPNSSSTKFRFTPASRSGPGKRKREDNLEAGPTAKAAAPPSLPSAFHGLYATNVRSSTSDDPSLHGGRKRQIVHIHGNWPSHVYLEWLPDKRQLQQLERVISHAQEILNHDAAVTTVVDTASSSKALSDGLRLTSFLRTTLSAQIPLHISLSAPLVLTTSTKNPFHDALVSAISTSRIGTIAVRLTSLDLVPNFERSRWFLILRLTANENSTDKRNGKGELGELGELEKLLDVCNRVCGEFELAKLYHTSHQVGVDVMNGKNVQEKEGENVMGSTPAPDDMAGLTDTGPIGVAKAFHISIAWMLKDPSDETKDAIRRVDLAETRRETILFETVKIKIGNVVSDVLL